MPLKFTYTIREEHLDRILLIPCIIDKNLCKITYSECYELIFVKTIITIHDLPWTFLWQF